MQHKKITGINAIALMLPFLCVLGTPGFGIIVPEMDKVSQDTIGTKNEIPFDPKVTKGKLANGFTYYIRRNTEPKDRVVLYLVNKVGSLLETDEQLGLAHFLEHMNFNGTRNFPKTKMITYLEKSGVKFGADLNAYTGYNETVYQLPIPSDAPELLENGFRIMRDWAQEALLQDKSIEKERNIVLQEMSDRKDMQARLREQYLPVLVNQSRFAYRLPIGTESIIKNFSGETLRSFHQNWYRPDLQALVVVGDIDVKQTEALINTLFSDLKVPAHAPERIPYTVPLTGRNQFVIATDQEMTGTVLQVITKYPQLIIRAVQDFKTAFARTLYNQMVSSRFNEFNQHPDPPFISGSNSISSFMGGLDVHSISVTARPGKLEPGAKAVFAEVERIKQHGFTEDELLRAKTNIIAGIDAGYAARNKKSSSDYANEYMDHFLHGALVPGEDYEYELARKTFTEITLADMQAIIGTYSGSVNRDILIMAQENSKEGLPDETSVNNWINAVAQHKLQPYKAPQVTRNLLEAKPAAGKAISRHIDSLSGITELTFSNGVKVILKPTNFKNDEIIFTAFSPGGTAMYADSDYYSASAAASIVSNSGLADLKGTEIQQYLAGKQLSVTPYIAEYFEGFEGGMAKADIETALEIIYLYFTRSRLDMDVFSGNTERQKAALESQKNTPSVVFSDSLNALLYNNSIRRQSLSSENVDKIDPERAFAIFKERFSNASDFTFTLVGNFEETVIVPLLEQYLGALPSNGNKETPPDLGIYAPEKGFAKTVYKGKQTAANVNLIFSGNYQYTSESNDLMIALAEVLTIRLTERLREKEGGVYSASASASLYKYPRSRYSFGIYFACSPDLVQRLINLARAEVEKISKYGVRQSDLEKIKEQKRRSIELAIKDNGNWLGSLTSAYQNSEDPKRILNLMESLKNITSENIKVMADKYLQEKHLFRFVLLPEL